MSEKYAFNIKKGTFADAVLKMYGPLNFRKKFRERYADKSFRILLNPIDGEYAALIHVDYGVLTVEGIETKNYTNLGADDIGWDGLMQTTIALFDEIGRGILSQNDIAKKLVTRKIKMKNVKIVSKLTEMMALMDD